MTVEHPVITPGVSTLGDSVETHPAYAQISAARVSGRGRLYQSEFDHQHFVIVSIHRSELHRGLSQDHPFEREELIEVALSEAQWATFISSLNNSRVPCTLTRLQGALVPDLPTPKRRTEQFSREMLATLGDALAHLTELRGRIANGKGGKESLSLLDRAAQEIRSNLRFVADQFDEHMEKTVEHAKVEVAAYVQQTLARAGIAALDAKAPISLAGTEMP